MTIQTEILSSEARNGMNYRREIWAMEGNPSIELDAVYNAHGVYVGDKETADFLAEKGILPEAKTPTSNVCSIGFSHQDQKWYGWSHRAMHGFGIGDIAKEGDCVCSSGWTDDYLAEHPEANTSLPVGFEAKTLDDAKRMAVAFADSVS